MQSKLPAEPNQNQVTSLRDATFYHLITEALLNYAHNLDSSDIGDRACLGYSDRNFNVFWRSDMTFVFKKFMDSRKCSAWTEVSFVRAAISCVRVSF